jgi:hypothetical protein
MLIQTDSTNFESITPHMLSSWKWNFDSGNDMEGFRNTVISSEYIISDLCHKKIAIIHKETYKHR